MSDTDSYFHIDRGRIFKSEKTPEGFLNCHAQVARVGELRYRNSNGSDRIERVTEEVLFNADSYNTLKMKPVTCPEHPPVMLDSKNTSQYSKGTTSNVVTIDGSFLGICLTITDQKAIDAIEAGTQEVSCGYMATTRPLPDGSFLQVTRDYNHLSVVPKGRAGREVRISMDSEDVPIFVQLDSLENTHINNDMSDVKTHDINLSSLKLDEYESISLPSDVADKIKSKFNSDAKTLEAVKAQLDKAKADYGSLMEEYKKLKAEAESNKDKEKTDSVKKCDRCDAITKILTDRKYDSFDAFLAKFDAQSEQIEALEKAKTDAAEINVNALVKQRVALERKCDGLVPADFKVDEASDRQLMEQVIIKNTKLSNCDGLTDDYIKARFDSVIELKENTDSSLITRKAANESGVTANNDSLSDVDKLRLDALNAQKEYLENLTKRS